MLSGLNAAGKLANNESGKAVAGIDIRKSPSEAVVEINERGACLKAGLFTYFTTTGALNMGLIPPKPKASIFVADDL
jgi:hypothetical protein